MGRGISERTRERLDAIREYAEENQPVTVRGCCYHLFTRGLIDSMAKKYTGEISRILTNAREEGDIPWEWIVDETRDLERVASWADPADFAEAVFRSYRKDRWRDQKTRVELWSEKGTVRGLLAPIIRKYQIPFRVMHGYSSATNANDIADQIADTVTDDKDFVALYCGDWDPSGLDMSERDLPDRLERYGRYVDAIAWTAPFTIKRIALTEDDLDGLPSFKLETKSKDPRHAWYKADYDPEVCWELDAMNPSELRERVEDEILSYIDDEKWARADQVERAERESIKEFSDMLKTLKIPG